MPFLWKTITTMQWMQVVDVVVASIPIYIGLRALHKATHRRVVIFFLVLFFLYCAAKAYRWQLTSVFLEYFGLVGIVGLFLLFQEDLRRSLESMMYSSVFNFRKKAGGHPKLAAQLVPIVAELARNKTGALIALEGRIPLLHLTKGGFPLDGELTAPLLYSIFDEHSQGHDGAVLIRHQRVARFGVHLPLPKKHVVQAGRVGTRHAAATGLSELSDALVIVVSEETGTISVARDGELRLVDDAQLQSELDQFYRVHEARFKVTETPKQVFSHWRLKLIAASTSLIMWLLFVAPRDFQQRTYDLSVTLKNVPTQLIVDEPMPNNLQVTLEGPETLFSLWREPSKIVSIDLANARPGTWKTALSSENMEIPDGLKVKRFDPPSIQMTAHKAKTLTVPVVVSLVGRRPQNQFVRVKTVPEHVPVVIREGDSGPSLVTTEPVEYVKLFQTKDLQVKIIPPAKSQFTQATPETVRVQVEKLIPN